MKTVHVFFQTRVSIYFYTVTYLIYCQIIFAYRIFDIAGKFAVVLGQNGQNKRALTVATLLDDIAFIREICHDNLLFLLINNHVSLFW